VDSASRYLKVVPARLGSLPAVSAFIAEICAAASLTPDLCLKLTLLVEELFVNTVTHGHGHDTEEPVSIAVEVGPGRVALSYEDTAPPYDPFGAVIRPDETADVEDRPVGGLGVLLVAALAKDAEYHRADDKNRIRLVVNSPA
jgi:serine/threonine-protein kinase RsbW